MHKSATKCNETLGKWCKNKHGASKIMDTLETYQGGRETQNHETEVVPAKIEGGNVVGVAPGRFLQSLQHHQHRHHDEMDL
jgi:hypothetical protein